jgi:C1A family cysteine protease
MPDPAYGLGAKPSLPDHRDRLFTPPRQLVQSELPWSSAVDLRAQGPLMWDQGSLGSCVPHGFLRAFNHAQRRQGLNLVSPSALFTYYVGRQIEGTIGYDSGLYLRDGAKAVNQAGVADRFAWPYDIRRFTERPPANAWSQGTGKQALVYERLVAVEDAYWALRAGFPVVMGFSVVGSFFDVGSDGLVPFPAAGERVEGGHCMLIEGYRPEDDRFIIANSWGRYWGYAGWCYFPRALFEWDAQIAFPDDLWVIKLVES